MMLKLDLGAGTISPEGFTSLGNINGTPIYPLPYADASVDCIRASHVLEHFPFAQVPAVLKEWMRVLKPGGELKIAVPDFGKIAEDYIAGKPQITEGYVMGGQTDAADYHKALFDKEHLTRLLAGSGLMLIRAWQSELRDDGASLPVSLNLAGTKPYASEISVSAVMSVPRLGFMDNFFCWVEALPSLKIRVRRHTGAYWSQCIERVIDQTIIEDKPDAILTLDYDTVFTRNDVAMLMQLMCCHPEADAIAALQSARGKDFALFTLSDAEKASGPINVPRERFADDLMPVATAHFGLTLLRSDKFKTLSHPWFLDVPDKEGMWGDGRSDADIEFWRKWKAAGNSVYIANRVPVGHLDLTVRWPGEDLKAIYQPVNEWRDGGKPKECWQ